jgi:hypothetical protein
MPGLSATALAGHGSGAPRRGIDRDQSRIAAACDIIA